jgi:hypothetical protein
LPIIDCFHGSGLVRPNTPENAKPVDFDEKRPVLRRRYPGKEIQDLSNKGSKELSASVHGPPTERATPAKATAHPRRGLTTLKAKEIKEIKETRRKAKVKKLADAGSDFRFASSFRFRPCA